MHHNLIGSLQDLVDAKVSEEPLYWVVLQVSVATMHLEAVVNNIEALVSGEFLCHRAIHSVVRGLIVNQLGSMANHQSRSFQVSSHLSQLKLDVLVCSDGLAKLLSCFYIFCGGLERGSGSS